jgi:hypothetical protein
LDAETMMMGRSQQGAPIKVARVRAALPGEAAARRGARLGATPNPVEVGEARRPRAVSAIAALVRVTRPSQAEQARPEPRPATEVTPATVTQQATVALSEVVARLAAEQLAAEQLAAERLAMAVALRAERLAAATPVSKARGLLTVVGKAATAVATI